jgi:REP element-mobilizing transposase RayT
VTVDNDARHRRSIRLRGYDYASAGAYFVTLVTRERGCILGEIELGDLRTSPIGKIAIEEWAKTAEIRPNVEVDAFIVMPNHLHGILFISGPTVGAHSCAPLRPPDEHAPPVRQPRSLGSLIAGFKAATTKRINALRDSPGVPVWQRNYYERIIRNEAELNRIRRYIKDNPARWDDDPENPAFARSAQC